LQAIFILRTRPRMSCESFVDLDRLMTEWLENRRWHARCLIVS
jgi:hypothetical protein